MFESVKLLIPLTAILFGTAMPVIIIWLFLRYRTDRNRLAYETALKLAEHGQPVPPELFSVTGKPDADLRRGVVLIMFGTALCVSLYEVGAPWTFGLIPALMGIGFLIVWQIEKHEETKLT